MRYRIQVFGWALIWSGLFIFGYLGWQVYGTDVLTARVQAAALDQLETRFERPPPQPNSVDTDHFLGEEVPDRPALPRVVAHVPEEPVAQGESFGLLSIPKLEIEGLVLYEGVDRETLKKGPGHMPHTPLPGQPGNAVISGHRTTYGRPFFDFDILEPGDRIEVETSAGLHVYEVRESRVVLPTDVWVTEHRSGGWLTFTTCEPKFSARQRLIVWAEMVAGPNLDYVDLHKLKAGVDS